MPPIAKNGDGGVRRRVADEFEPDRGPPRLGRCLVNRADADVVDTGRGVDLRRAVRGQADQPVRAGHGPRVRDVSVVLADMDAVRADRLHEVGPVVEDEQRAVRRRGGREPAAGGHDRVIAGVLHPQLDDVDAGPERAGQELVGSVVAHQVEMRRPQALIGDRSRI